MKFSDLETWLKTHWLSSTLLTVLFLFGIVFQTTDTIDRICRNYEIRFCTRGLDYTFVSLHLDHTEHTFDHIEEGVGMDNPVIAVRGAETTSAEIARVFQNVDAGDLFVFQIKGTGSMTDDGVMGEIPAHDSIDGANAPFVLQIDISPEKFDESRFIIHFPSIDPDAGEDFFESGPANCCEPYFNYQAFVRLVPFREKMQFGSNLQFRAKFVDPSALIAGNARDRFDAPSDFNRLFGGMNAD